MRRWHAILLGSTVVTTSLFLTMTADGHGGGGGGGHGGGSGGGHAGGGYGGHYAGGYHHDGGYYNGGYHHGGYYYPYHGNAMYYPYRPGLYAPYGFYRPYYGYGGFGPGLGFGGLGYGLGGFGLGYGLGYGLGGYGLGGYGGYQPYYGTTIVNPTVVVAPLAVGQAPTASAPPPDNAAHLQLVVPENAEVLFDGGKTTQTGTMREFVSPPLLAGKLFDYTITVRTLDADGKVNADKRVIHVRANDWFRIDFTRPAPAPEPLPTP